MPNVQSIQDVANIDCDQLKTWLATGKALLVDVREPAEFSEARICYASSMPLSNISQHLSHLKDEKRKVVFQCASGDRAKMAAATAQQHFGNTLAVYNLDGGIEAWKKSGLAVVSDNGKSAKLPIMRQVQIGAGSIVLVFSLLTLLGISWGAFVTLFIGCGLTFAGMTGWCGMAILLQKMPWNK